MTRPEQAFYGHFFTTRNRNHREPAAWARNKELGGELPEGRGGGAPPVPDGLRYHRRVEKWAAGPTGTQAPSPPASYPQSATRSLQMLGPGQQSPSAQSMLGRGTAEPSPGTLPALPLGDTAPTAVTPRPAQCRQQLPPSSAGFSDPVCPSPGPPPGQALCLRGGCRDALISVLCPFPQGDWRVSALSCGHQSPTCQITSSPNRPSPSSFPVGAGGLSPGSLSWLGLPVLSHSRGESGHRVSFPTPVRRFQISTESSISCGCSVVPVTLRHGDGEHLSCEAQT